MGHCLRPESLEVYRWWGAEAPLDCQYTVITSFIVLIAPGTAHQAAHAVIRTYRRSAEAPRTGVPRRIRRSWLANGSSSPASQPSLDPLHELHESADYRNRAQYEHSNGDEGHHRPSFLRFNAFFLYRSHQPAESSSTAGTITVLGFLRAAIPVREVQAGGNME